MNDLWWGYGVTEWNNVTRGLPQFKGHLQPRVPGELGYYNLETPGVQQRQAELALQAGISCFAFYYYSFGNGRRILERPLLSYASDPSISLPFCICWANESWTRRFDGVSSDVLMEQDNSIEHCLGFASEIEAFVLNRKYFRVGSRPLLVIYRPENVPSIGFVIDSWRKFFISKHKVELFVVAVRNMDRDVNYLSLGFDGVTDFQPRQVMTCQRPVNGGETAYSSAFSGKIFDYAEIVNKNLYEKPLQPGYFPAVCSGWDNTPRRFNAGVIYKNCLPQYFEKWLTSVAGASRSLNEHNLVFLNAWNEWGEGAVLEPDSYFGYAFLEAIKRSIKATRV